MKTAILHLRHTKLSAFWNLTVPYLTATNDHTQDGPTHTYAVTLAFAHASMEVCTHICTLMQHGCALALMCSHALIVCATVHMYTHIHVHIHLRIQIYAHAHATTYTSGHIHTVCCILPHTYSRSDMHAHSLMQAHSCTNTSYSHSCTQSCPLTLVNAHSCMPTHAHPLVHAYTPVHQHTLAHAHTIAHAHTLTHARRHLNPPKIRKHTPRSVGIHWLPRKYSFHLGA